MLKFYFFCIPFYPFFLPVCFFPLCLSPVIQTLSHLFFPIQVDCLYLRLVHLFSIASSDIFLSGVAFLIIFPLNIVVPLKFYQSRYPEDDSVDEFLDTNYVELVLVSCNAF